MNTQTLQRIALPEMNAATVTKEIGDFIIGTVRASGANGAVIGLSGGVDSTTVAALAHKAFRDEGSGLELVGYVLPSATNQNADTEDGVSVAEQLGIRYEVHSLEPLVQAYALTNAEAANNKFHRGNMTSRIRATVLNTKAATEQKVLLGTGNRDEDYGIGYYTLFGDGAVHCSPIGGLSKRLVRELATYLGFENLAHREPTAGLESGQTDFKDLGYSYDLVEIVTAGLDSGITREELATHEQVAPRFAREQTQYSAQFGAPRYERAEAMIDDIVRRHSVALRKAQLISPAIAPVTLSYR
jgi:NAD+ synthase